MRAFRGPVALAAMRADKHALVEEPATMDVDSCWELVETSEQTRRHCMMLENCCYGEHEMLALNMCRTGALGETVYGEAGYLHSGAARGFKLSAFRAEWYQEHRGNYYPTHGLGPVAQYMNINRGDETAWDRDDRSREDGFLQRWRRRTPADDRSVARRMTVEIAPFRTRNMV